jgi:NAD(P)-dependent dehydrogenase (short-subunit alcohol dehydrogenase family)
MSVNDKVVLITGGALGVGRFCALQFAGEGAKVSLCDIDDEGLAEIDEKLTPITDGEHIAKHADIRDEESVKSFVAQTAEKFGRIDVLINNAAIVPHFMWGTEIWPPVQDMDFGFWKDVFDTNVHGSFLYMKYVVPHMLSQGGGHIINLHSGKPTFKPGTTSLNNSRGCPYFASKTALYVMTRYFGEDLKESNICIVSMSGAVIATDRAPEHVRAKMPGPEVLGRRFLLAAECPMELSGRWVEEGRGGLVPND